MSRTALGYVLAGVLAGIAALVICAYLGPWWPVATLFWIAMLFCFQWAWESDR